jgi:protein-arginine kinase activator protein McsA
MQNFRPLQPAPSRPVQSDQRSITREHAQGHVGQNDKRERRKRHTDKEWEDQKEYLTQLLYTKTIEEAAKVIEQTRGFKAG